MFILAGCQRLVEFVDIEVGDFKKNMRYRPDAVALWCMMALNCYHCPVQGVPLQNNSNWI